MHDYHVIAVTQYLVFLIEVFYTEYSLFTIPCWFTSGFDTASHIFLYHINVVT